MKTFKGYLAEADTSGATNTEMAICYQYNMLKFNDHDKALSKAGISEDKFEQVVYSIIHLLVCFVYFYVFKLLE